MDDSTAGSLVGQRAAWWAARKAVPSAELWVDGLDYRLVRLWVVTMAGNWAARMDGSMAAC